MIFKIDRDHFVIENQKSLMSETKECEICIIKPMCVQINASIGYCEIQRFVRDLEVLEHFKNDKKVIPIFTTEGGYTLITVKYYQQMANKEYDIKYKIFLSTNKEFILKGGLK